MISTVDSRITLRGDGSYNRNIYFAVNLDCRQMDLRFVGLLLILISTNALLGQTWTGSGDGISWNDPDNWNPIGLPSSNDDIIIDVPDSVVIKNGVTAEGRSLTLDGADVALTVEAGASLSLINSTGVGLSSDTASIYNFGFIFINKTVSHGLTLSSRAVFHNHDSISISLIANEGLVNSGRFINHSQGGVHILDINGPGNHALLNNGYLENEGSLYIDDVEDGRALHNVDSLINKGTCSISNISCSGCLAAVYFQDYSRNEMNGMIAVDAISGASVYGLRVEDDFQNLGEIIVSDVQNHSGVIASGFDVFNFGSLNIQDVALHGLVVTEDFTNAGTITVARAASSGLLNLSTLTNDFFGTIQISDLDTVSGVACSNRDTILNDGIISLSQAKLGYRHADLPGETPFLNNTGTVAIDSVDTGIEMKSGGLSNGATVTVELTEVALVLDGANLTNANNGNLMLDTGVDGISLINSSTLNNFSNADIQITNVTGLPLIVASGCTFDSLGTLTTD